MTGRAGRRPGPNVTRAAILGAARARFAAHGYAGATLRAIAADAGVDPALIRHFFATKENLFVAAMALPASPGVELAGALPGDPAQLGDRILCAVLGVWERPAARATALALLRSAATHEQAAVMLQEFFTAAIVRRIGLALGGGADAERRAALAAGQIAGVILTRYVLRIGPIAAMELDELRAAVAPALQRYLTGAIGPGAGQPSPAGRGTISSEQCEP